ncbi:uncharacterized protein [Palaemon carinicauda]|uniref:uncharacterized protein n=1 Tax=Palaemon carinicauda TaxID=392227 RepID=UPI0035B65C83
MKFIWHSITKDANDLVCACTSCQTSKVPRHTDPGVVTFPQPQHGFAHFHVDIVDPVPTSQGHGYLFTIINRSTRWPKAIPMETAIFASYLANILGITLGQTTAYNPTANGMDEPFHSTLKADLMSRCKDSNWFTKFSWALLGLMTTPKDALDVLGSLNGEWRPVEEEDEIVLHRAYFVEYKGEHFDLKKRKNGHVTSECHCTVARRSS